MIHHGEQEPNLRYTLDRSPRIYIMALSCCIFGYMDFHSGEHGQFHMLTYRISETRFSNEALLSLLATMKQFGDIIIFTIANRGLLTTGKF